ncbi:MAG: biopolymer transporter ExbD [Myxococcaceae bacterium]|nr:biopolymer transporter ExbD [Myxococcaceae bacterium]MCI0672171.1 biopolymer transporter ExbD [Myxococcaceae bacterium]
MAHAALRRRRTRGSTEDTGELNLVPYLDILMNLIIFMLMSITGLASFGILNVTAPAYAGPEAAQPQGSQAEPRLQLSVHISREGLFISSNRAILGAEAAAPTEGGGRAPTLPRRADGSYDLPGLTQKMVSIKDAFPGESAIILVAEPDVSYETLVQVMDAVRETPGPARRLLFSDVQLGELLDG